jgi:hypothetical protein
MPISFEDESHLPVVLQVRLADAEFCARLAEHRNAVAVAQGKRLRKQWTRKSIAEVCFAAGVDAIRARLSEMEAACGPLPEADATDEARERYAKRVLAWEQKSQK